LEAAVLAALGFPVAAFEAAGLAVAGFAAEAVAGAMVLDAAAGLAVAGLAVADFAAGPLAADALVAAVLVAAGLEAALDARVCVQQRQRPAWLRLLSYSQKLWCGTFSNRTHSRWSFSLQPVCGGLPVSLLRFLVRRPSGRLSYSKAPFIVRSAASIACSRPVILVSPHTKSALIAPYCRHDNFCPEAQDLRANFQFN
jgi:hypothetical protein